MNAKDILYDYNLPPDPDADIMDILEKGSKNIYQFSYDKLKESVPLFSIFSEQECGALYKIATSIKYAGNKQKKLQEISNIMRPKGFFRLAGGTNRVVYYNPDIPDLVWKIATDDTGLRDNPAEMYNQQFIKPYCTKVYSCHPSGIIASFERVQRITNYYEFEEMRNSIFDIITKKLIGKYVLEDFGIDYFMNWGFRKNFGPVILDFPYVYEVIGERLKCGVILENGSICGGDIDYTPDFNRLVCTKCGTSYRARELGKSLKESNSSLERKGKVMKITILRGNEVIKTSYQKDTVEYLGKPAKARSWRHRIESNGPVQSDSPIDKNPHIVISKGHEPVNVGDGTPTVYGDIEKKRDISVSIERTAPQDHKVETNVEEKPVVNPRAMNIPKGYVRDIKMGRVVGYRSLYGGEYIPVESPTINKESSGIIAAQKKVDEQIRKQNESGTNADILDKITGSDKSSRGIVTETESLRAAPVVAHSDKVKVEDEVAVSIFTDNDIIEDTSHVDENVNQQNDGITENNTVQDEVKELIENDVKDETASIDTSSLVDSMMRNSIPDTDSIKIPESLKEDVERANEILQTKLEDIVENPEKEPESDTVDNAAPEEIKEEVDVKSIEPNDQLSNQNSSSDNIKTKIPKLTPARGRGKVSIGDILNNY